MTKKEQEELAALRETSAAIRQRIDKIETAERVAQANNIVGKCFKARNSYSCPETPSDYWWMYVKVLSVDEHGWIRSVCLQIDKDGNVDVRYVEQLGSIPFQNYKQITARAFRDAWLATMQRMDEIGKEVLA